MSSFLPSFHPSVLYHSASFVPLLRPSLSPFGRISRSSRS
jgi:hypothetical protein